MKTMISCRWLGGCLTVGLATLFAWGQEPRRPVQVVIKDGKVVQEEVILPVDPTPHIRIGQQNGMYFGLQVEVKVHSSTGVTQLKNISIQPAY